MAKKEVRTKGAGACGGKRKLDGSGGGKGQRVKQDKKGKK